MLTTYIFLRKVSASRWELACTSTQICSAMGRVLNEAWQTSPDDKHESTPDLNRIQEFVAARVPPNNLFKIRLLTELDVERFLRKLDIRKATGLDNIDAKFLKLAAPFILNTLKEIRNLSISTKTFPTSWKVAKVSSLYKNNSKDDPNNYGPISALPILSKLLERHAADHLLNS